MTGPTAKNVYTTQIWQDIPSDNPDHSPFVAQKSLCYGYDVFGDIIKHGHFIDYLYLVMTGRRLSPEHQPVFEALLIALAHPGLRDASVRAAMNAGVGGSRAAAALSAALAVGAGQYTGAHEVCQSMQIHLQAQTNHELWRTSIAQALEPQDCDVWLQPEHVPGFDPHQTSMAKPCLQLLEHCASLLKQAGQSHWLVKNYQKLEADVGYGVSFTGAVAAILVDLGFTPEVGEYVFLFSRLPGAAAHASETRQQGFKTFPFFHDLIALDNDPGPSNRDNIKTMMPNQK